MKQNHQDPYSAAFGLLGHLSSVIGACVSLSVVAYLVGWVEAHSYLHQFKACWITRELGTTHILEASLTPLFYLLVPGFMVVGWLQETWPKTNIPELIWSFIGVSAAMIVAGWYSHNSLRIAVIHSAPFIGGLLAAILFGAILILVHRKVREHSGLAFLSYLLAIVALWVSPTIVGTINGRRDSNPHKTTLPKVSIQGASSGDQRLLHSSQGLLYVVELSTTPNTISIREATSVTSIGPVEELRD